MIKSHAVNPSQGTWWVCGTMYSLNHSLLSPLARPWTIPQPPMIQNMSNPRRASSDISRSGGAAADFFL